MESPRICFVMPYFGRWPFWMPFFLKSCRCNPSIDWLFFSDCGPLPDCPPNVRIVPITFDAYCQRVSQALKIDFKPQRPYKLCDIRPAFGVIHKKELAGYDFWGFSDIDLIYGDLRAYFTARRLSRRDLFSTHARRVAGHLCLIRNNTRMRYAFTRIPDWQGRFCDPDHHALDEGAFSRIFLRHKNLPQPLRHLLGQFNPWYRRSEFVEAFSTPCARIDWIDGSRNFPAKWHWRAGKLTNDRDGQREFPYFHFIVWKQSDQWKSIQESACSQSVILARQEAWTVTCNGFKRFDDDPAYQTSATAPGLQYQAS